MSNVEKSIQKRLKALEIQVKKQITIEELTERNRSGMFILHQPSGFLLPGKNSKIKAIYGTLFILSKCVPDFLVKHVIIYMRR